MTSLPTIVVVVFGLATSFGGILLVASRRAASSVELERRRAGARRLMAGRRAALAGRTSARRSRS